MKINAKLYTVQISGGFLNEMESWRSAYHINGDQNNVTSASSYKHMWNVPEGREREEFRTWAEENPDEAVRTYPHYSTMHIDMDQEQFLEYCMLESNPTIIKTREVSVAIPPDMMPGQLANQSTLMEHILSLNERCIEQLTRASAMCFNDKVGVPQPGLGLNQYNSMMLCEDVCTDQLQGYLDDGWRIIAVCPQPDSRRPDYILGIYDKDHKTGHRAERG